MNGDFAVSDAGPPHQLSRSGRSVFLQPGAGTQQEGIGDLHGARVRAQLGDQDGRVIDIALAALAYPLRREPEAATAPLVEQ